MFARILVIIALTVPYVYIGNRMMDHILYPSNGAESPQTES